MDKSQAQNLIKTTFENKFDKSSYRNFVINLLDGIDETKEFTYGNAYVPESFRNYVTSYGRLGKYIDTENRDIEVLWVSLKKETSLDRARTIQRNFIAWYLNGGRGNVIRHNALVAFYNETVSDWRFSFVKLDTGLKQDESGKIKVINEFTPAKRYSFLVGELEPNHTAQSRLIGLLTKDYPLVSEIEEAFNVEKVSKEFFANYKELFLQLVDNLKEIRANDDRIHTEFTLKSIKESDFCKKLLGQLVFLYFIQKKGWLGVPVSAKWGDGDKQFLRHTFERAVQKGENFFNDYLEPLFYNALANGERDEQYFELLDCKIPFLNGGLFETIGGYDWVNTDIVFDNEIFSNNVKTKSGDIGTGILDVFDRYNFTVKEDEPLEKEVAVDPEMLGKVFEELLEVQDRKSKGAFYTPREIVHYMCQESLINYLATELNAVDQDTSPFAGEVEVVDENLSRTNSGEGFNGLTKQALADFIHHSDKLTQTEALATQKENANSKYQHILSDSIRNNAEAIDKALENIKICDPAIGSGAFPVGMMNEIVRARIALVESGFLKEAKKRTTYEYKRQAIQNSIYGVDIEAGAVEIAKLRLWLSLVVDEENIENIKALPNLDYKIVQGNSLLGVERNLFNDILFRQLEELKPQYFNETSKIKKRQLKKQIDDIIKELTKDGTFDFEIYFSEVFNEKGGFDVVIGNPPYIGQKGNKNLFEPMKKHPAFEKKMDYWYFFLYEAYHILNNRGINSFITPNYWITAQGGKKLRNKFVNDFRIIEIINFNQNNIFTAGVHTNVFILSKSKKDNNIFDYCIFNNNYENNFIEHKKQEQNFQIKQSNIYSSWSGFVNFLPDYVLNITNKLIINAEKLCDNESVGTSQKGVVIGKRVTNGICNINQGIVTGKDRYINKVKNINTGVFVLNKAELDFLNLQEKEKLHIKDFYKNSDIKQYYINKKNKNYLVYVNDVNDEKEFELLDNLYNHIRSHKEILKERSINGVLESAYKKGKWWALTTDRPNINFEGVNIVCPQRSSRNTFAYSDNAFYSASDIFYISQNKNDMDLKYILAILNSNLIYFWLYWLGKRKGDILELTFEPLQYIPIKKINVQTQNKFISVVDKILEITQTEDYLQNQEKQSAVHEYEKQIDIMVYKLYDLTSDEVLTIDKDFTLTEQQYNEYEL